VIFPGVAGHPEIEHSVVGIAAVPEVDDSGVDVPGVVFVGLVFVVDLDVAQHWIVFVADVAEPQASVDIAVAFDLLGPVSVVAFADDSPGRPTFLALTNVHYYASSSSSVEVLGRGSVHSSTDVRTTYGHCSILSNLDLHQNKNLEHRYNKPIPDYNKGNDTNHPPRGATTNHSRNKGLQIHQEQRIHRPYPAILSQPAGPQLRWGAAEEFQ